MSHIDLADKRLRFVDVPLPLSEVSLRQRRRQRRIKKVPTTFLTGAKPFHHITRTSYAEPNPRRVETGGAVNDLSSRPLEKADFDHIVRVIDKWWGGPTSALAHPIYFYELGQLARVVECEGLMVGFLFGFVTPGVPVGYVHLVGIHPDFRRRGVAKLLYSTFESDCKEAGAKRLKAITTMGNEGSVRFHEAVGWTVSEVEDYAGRDRHRIVFTKSLD